MACDEIAEEHSAQADLTVTCGLGQGLDEKASAERWFCVHTQPRKEIFAAQNLRQQSYRCFLPTIKRTIRHARQVHKIKAAFFPRYLFVRLNPDIDGWRPIRSTFGVSGLIMERDRPKPVPSGIVEALQEAVDVSGCVDFRDDVVIGGSVRLLSGPFADLVGKLKEQDERGRVAVLLNILGGERVVYANSAAMISVSA